MSGIACTSALLESQIRSTKLLSAIPGINHVFKNLNWLFFPLLGTMRWPPPYIFIERKAVFYIDSADGS